MHQLGPASRHTYKRLTAIQAHWRLQAEQLPPCRKMRDSCTTWTTTPQVAAAAGTCRLVQRQLWGGRQVSTQAGASL